MKTGDGAGTRLPLKSFRRRDCSAMTTVSSTGRESWGIIRHSSEKRHEVERECAAFLKRNLVVERKRPQGRRESAYIR